MAKNEKSYTGNYLKPILERDRKADGELIQEKAEQTSIYEINFLIRL